MGFGYDPTPCAPIVAWHTARVELEKRGMYTEATFDAARDYTVSSLGTLAQSDDFPAELVRLRAEMAEAKAGLLALQAA